MLAWRRVWREERGVALISALGALLLLTPLVLALLSMSTFELLVSRNLLDATQAVFAAEAGIEWAFSLLVNTPEWSTLLGGPEDQPGALLTVPSDLLPGARITVTLGQAALANDVTVTSTGNVSRAQRTITAIVRRDPATPGPALARHAVVSWREH